MEFTTSWQNFMTQLKAENIHNISVGIGVFDGVHLGHAELFRTLSEYAEANNSYPIALTFAPHPRKLTSPDNPPKLLVPLNQRIELLKQHGAKKVFVIDFLYSRSTGIMTLSGVATQYQCFHKAFHPVL